MQTPESQGRLFYAIFFELLRFVNRKLGLVEMEDSDAGLMAIPPDERMEIRDALYEPPECFDEYVEVADRSLAPDVVDIGRGWRDHHVRGTFYVMRHLEPGTVFMAVTRSSPSAERARRSRSCTTRSWARRTPGRTAERVALSVSVEVEGVSTRAPPTVVRRRPRTRWRPGSARGGMKRPSPETTMRPRAAAAPMPSKRPARTACGQPPPPRSVE